MKIRPLRNRVPLRRMEEEKTKYGTIIPYSDKEEPMKGKLIAVRKGEVSKDGKLIHLEVKQGDTVLFVKYAGIEIRIEGEEHVIVRENDILGIVEQ